VPNPVLDAVLTALFVGQVAWLLWHMVASGTAPEFAAVMAGVHVVVLLVQAGSTRLGRALSARLLAAGAVPADPLSGRVQLKKWQEQCWQLAVHAGFTAVELALLTGENAAWWDDPRTCWIPHPRDQHPLHTPLLRYFYLAQLAVWIYTCFVHRFLDERRKDYFVMYIHHIVTIGLVGMSWQSGYWRIGLIIVYVHDISDIFVDVLKLVNYLKLEGPRGWYASEAAYAACVLSWMYWRLWRLPFRAIRGSFIDAWDVFATYPRQSSQLLVFGYELSPVRCRAARRAGGVGPARPPARRAR